MDLVGSNQCYTNTHTNAVCTVCFSVNTMPFYNDSCLGKKTDSVSWGMANKELESEIKHCSGNRTPSLSCEMRRQYPLSHADRLLSLEWDAAIIPPATCIPRSGTRPRRGAYSMSSIYRQYSQYIKGNGLLSLCTQNKYNQCVHYVDTAFET